VFSFHFPSEIIPTTQLPNESIEERATLFGYRYYNELTNQFSESLFNRNFKRLRRGPPEPPPQLSSPIILWVNDVDDEEPSLPESDTTVGELIIKRETFLFLSLSSHAGSSVVFNPWLVVFPEVEAAAAALAAKVSRYKLSKSTLLFLLILGADELQMLLFVLSLFSLLSLILLLVPP